MHIAAWVLIAGGVLMAQQTDDCRDRMGFSLWVAIGILEIAGAW